MGNYDDILHAQRPEPLHPRQTVDNRAKQFMPFDALRGFSLAVLTKETERQFLPKTELSTDAQEVLDRKLRRLSPGDEVTVTWFEPQQFIGGLELGVYRTERLEYLTVDEAGRELGTTQRDILLENLLDIAEEGDEDAVEREETDGAGDRLP